MVEIFRKDRKTWTRADEEQVEYFFKCNSFFSQIYEDRYFEDIVQLAFYSKISPDSPLYLTDNKRSVAIVLLKGNIGIYKRENVGSPRKKLKSGMNQMTQVNPIELVSDFVKIGECLRYNETIGQSSECKVQALHGTQAEIIFVPYFLYNKFVEQVKAEKDKVIFLMLSKVFKNAENRYVMDLAREDCRVKDLKFNTSIYEEGDKPESVFIIIEGSAKIERPGLRQKNVQMVVVSNDSLLGQKDINLNKRLTSAYCCSSSIRLLEIPKEPFLKFAKLCLPELKLQQIQILLARKSKLQESPKKQENAKLPMIMGFRSAKRSEEQSEREYRFIKNSHVLLEASRPNKNRIRSKSSYSEYPKDMMEEKIKLFKKLRPIETKVDLSHRIL